MSTFSVLVFKGVPLYHCTIWISEKTSNGGLKLFYVYYIIIYIIINIIK